MIHGGEVDEKDVSNQEHGKGNIKLSEYMQEYRDPKEKERNFKRKLNTALTYFPPCPDTYDRQPVGGRVQEQYRRKVISDLEDRVLQTGMKKECLRKIKNNLLTTSYQKEFSRSIDFGRNGNIKKVNWEFNKDCNSCFNDCDH